METHRELAALVARAGPGVLDDAQEFRAAFDDYVPDDVTSEGELNLLTDAIRLDALRRVRAQVHEGADPARAVALQAERLAQQRGTKETQGARWALDVLLFALGEVDEAAVGAQRPTPPPAVPPRPTMPAPATRLVDTVLPPAPVSAEPGLGRGRGRRVLGIVGVIVVLAAVGSAFVLTRGDEVPPTPRGSFSSTTAGPVVVPVGTVLATDAVAPPAPPAPVVMAGRTGGVRVTGLGRIDQVGNGSTAQVAGPGEQLLALTLADGPCQQKVCDPWQGLGIEIVADGVATPLPAGGPTFVVAAAITAVVELRYDADSYDQRVSLVDGSPTGRNIGVLTRADRRAKVEVTRVVHPTAAGALLGAGAVRTVRVGGAELFFFNGAEGLKNPDRAYLSVDVSYTTPGDPTPSYFRLSELHLEGAGGKPYPRRDLTPTTPFPDVVFVVPADFTDGTLVISGTRRTPTVTSTGGTGSVLLTLPRTTIPIDFE